MSFTETVNALARWAAKHRIEYRGDFAAALEAAKGYVEFHWEYMLKRNCDLRDWVEMWCRHEDEPPLVGVGSSIYPRLLV